MSNEILVKQTIITTLREAMEITHDLVALFPVPFLGTPAIYSDRDLAELLRHTAWIPKEEILLLRGLDKETMRKELGSPVCSLEDLRSAFEESSSFFETSIAPLDLEMSFSNATGRNLSVFAWCLEMLNHFMHHRSQIYLNLLAHDVHPSSALLSRLFAGHLPIMR